MEVREDAGSFPDISGVELAIAINEHDTVYHRGSSSFNIIIRHLIETLHNLIEKA